MHGPLNVKNVCVCVCVCFELEYQRRIICRRIKKATNKNKQWAYRLGSLRKSGRYNTKIHIQTLSLSLKQAIKCKLQRSFILTVNLLKTVRPMLFETLELKLKLYSSTSACLFLYMRIQAKRCVAARGLELVLRVNIKFLASGGKKSSFTQ